MALRECLFIDTELDFLSFFFSFCLEPGEPKSGASFLEKEKFGKPSQFGCRRGCRRTSSTLDASIDPKL